MGTRSSRPDPELRGKGAGFAATRWSLVAAAGGRGAPAAAALGQLCELYWEPVYVYLRRRGAPPDDAADLTQGFFARLLEKGEVRGADPARGRFRAYLLGAVKHYAANERSRGRALKRGGAGPAVSLDCEGAEARYGREAVEVRTPESLFERRWAMGVLQSAMEQLACRYRDEGKRGLFDILQPCLFGEGKAPSHAEMAARLGMNANTLRVAVHRLRRRYREALRATVADTVSDASEIDEEIRFLISCIEG